jgi:gluconate 5-dehydrogenase
MTPRDLASGLDRFSLAGRVTLVTGATRGLGFEIARGMAAVGAMVGINGRDPARVREIAQNIPNAFPAPFDITDPSTAATAIEDIVTRHGRLDCLVNNAAVRDRRPLGPRSFVGDPAYVASKGGVEALMRALAVELGGHGIAANAIAPGFFRTEGNARFFDQPRVAELARRIPLQRFGRPDEVVGAAIFLASDAASYITGQVLTIDAGLSVAL